MKTARALLPLAFLCLAAGASSQVASASAPPGLEGAAALLAGSYLFSPAPCVVLRLEMDISGGGESKKRELELSLDRRNGRTLTMARIVSPAFLSSMKFLKRSEPGQADAQWVKTSKGLRRLGDSNRSEPVFGSDFTAEDFGSVDSAGFTLSLAPERDTEAARAVAAVPKGKASYAMRVVFVDRDSSLISGMEYLDASGRALRRYRVLESSSEGGRSRPTLAVMADLESGSETRLRVLSSQSPQSLPERSFNPGAL
jgi:hypothetical protein